MMLRLQLYTAMQELKGDDLREFWALLDEIQESRDMFSPEPEAAEAR